MRKVIKVLLCFWLVAPATIFASERLTQALELASLLPQKAVAEIQKLLQDKPGKNGVIYVPTLSQGSIKNWPNGALRMGLSWEDIKAGDGANCGYHALKNVLFLMNALTQNNAKYINDLLNSKLFFDCMSVWAPIIYGYRDDSLPINDLQGNEVDLLVKDLARLKVVPSLSGLDIDFEIVVIEEIQRLQRAAGIINEKIYEPTKKLAQQNNGKFGAVWNTGGGHWVAFVVNKTNGVQKIFYMDSCGSCNRDCRDAVNIFTKTIEDIDKIGIQNQKATMLNGLAGMMKTVDILSGLDADQKIYSHYVGCVQRNSSMLDDFTRDELIKAGIDGRYLAAVNFEWKKYLDKEISQKTKGEARENYEKLISAQKKRLYGFWIDPKKDNVFVLTLDFNDCAVASNKYQNAMLLLDTRGDASFFDPLEKIDAVFVQILVRWQQNDQAAFDERIQQQMLQVLATIFVYLREHPVLFRAINWRQFGNQNIRKFAGLQAVVNALLQRITIPEFDKAKFKKDYVEPLLQL